MARQRKQTEIPGAEREVDEELDEAAGRVRDLTRERLAKHADEKEARAALIALLHEKDLKSYLFVDGEDRFTVTLEENEKVKVQKAKEE